MKYLNTIQAESTYYSMNLNYDKWIILSLNQVASSIKYLDGTLNPPKYEAPYLDSILADTIDNPSNRIADAIIRYNKLKDFGIRVKL